MLGLGLAFQVAVSPLAAMPGVSAMPADRVTDSLRKAESDFFGRWRKTWILTKKTDLSVWRLASLHCHHDGSWKIRMPSLIRSEIARRSFCPVWFPKDESLPSDESVGGPDASLTEAGRASVRDDRARLIEAFRAAAERQPDNPWLAGQLVRLNVDQRDLPAAARAASKCGQSKAWCALLEGFVRQVEGHSAAADSIFGIALAAMSAADRCEWTSVAPLLDARSRDAYRRIPCPDRDSVDAKFWWLADPLYVEAGNERRAEHFARMVMVRLRAALTLDERWDWRPRYGADALVTMIIRHGWPSFLSWGGSEEDAGHFGWLGFHDGSLNVAPEYNLSGFHMTPSWSAVLDPWRINSAEWSEWSPRPVEGVWDTYSWPIEHAVRGNGAILELPDQMVLFRREKDALMAIGLDVPSNQLAQGPRLPYQASIITSRDPSEQSVSVEVPAALDGMTTTVLVTPLASQPQIVSAEIAPANGEPGAAARARRGVRPPAPLAELSPGEVAISDPLFFRPPDGPDLPASAVEAIERMLGSMTLTGKRVGIFWETYGVPPTDTVEMALRLTREDRPGLLRRLGTSLRVLGAEVGELAVNWTEPRLGEHSGISYAGDVPIQARSVVLDISRMKPGRYMVEISVARPRGSSVRSRRQIVVQ